jgi:MFS family permease
VTGRRYQRLLVHRGARTLLAGGLLGRLPTSMFPVALVIAGQQLTGSYAFGGAMAAGFSLSSALAAPITGGIVDRVGQRIAGRALLALFLAWSGLLVANVAGGAPRWSVIPLCVLAGATLPNVGAYTRVRWSSVATGEDVESAQALESINDEINYLVGPAGATILATTIGPIVPLLVAMSGGLVGALVVTASSIPEAGDRARTQRDPRRLRSRPLSVLRGQGWILLVVLGLGMALNGVLVTVVATTEAFGRPGLASIVFALNSTASLVSALVVGRIVFRRPITRRITLATAIYVATLVPYALATGPTTFMLAGLVAGAAISPIFIFSNSFVAMAVDKERATEAFSWLIAGVGVGLSLGSALVGAAVDAFGAAGARYVVLAFAALPLLASLIGQRYTERAEGGA